MCNSHLFNYKMNEIIRLINSTVIVLVAIKNELDF